jgi:hypothetical protein
MKKLSEIDITDSIKLISDNAKNEDFITKTVRDIYELGYSHGYADCEKVAMRAISKMSEI